MEKENMTAGTMSEEETGDGASNIFADEEEVVGDDITEEKKSGLEHEGRAFHDEMEVSRGNSVHLTMSVMGVIDDRSTHFGLGVTIEPCLSDII